MGGGREGEHAVGGKAWGRERWNGGGRGEGGEAKVRRAGKRHHLPVSMLMAVSPPRECDTNTIASVFKGRRAALASALILLERGPSESVAKLDSTVCTSFSMDAEVDTRTPFGQVGATSAVPPLEVIVQFKLGSTVLC